MEFFSYISHIQSSYVPTMLTKTIALLVLFKAIRGNFLDGELIYRKPKLERNNVVNKGIWVRNKHKDNIFGKTKIGDFIFRENTPDINSLLENNFDTFGANYYMEESPSVSSYVKRDKRAIRRIEQRTRKSTIRNCIGIECYSFTLEKQQEPVKPKNGDDHGTTSVFNEYPNEIAILLNDKSESNTPNNDTQIFINKNNYNLSKSNDIIREPKRLTVETNFKENNDTIAKNITSSKRSMEYDFENEIIKNVEYAEDVNKTQKNDERKIIDRNLFDKDDTVWRQNAPIPDVNIYKVLPKTLQESKQVTEKGLLKVISMLTKTFKKVMKQHKGIKDIHERISDVNDEFIKNTVAITNKFKDFDLKYLYLLKLHEKLKMFDGKLAKTQEYFKKKENEMAINFKEFENQQEKFLQQQRQFYNIQKLMLAQNEKINLKQNLIAKTQNEISHRQNNFARILKKARQLYIESRHPLITKPSSNLIKTTHSVKVEPATPTSTTTPTTESVKINLFSIPKTNKFENQDDLIIKEKDKHNIDDLVYKYYFNNTFIDNLMKNNVMSSFVSSTDNSGYPRNVKNKRNELETTILLPVFESDDSEGMVSKNRERRWINHHSRHKNKRRNRGKNEAATIINATDAKSFRKVTNNGSLGESLASKETKNVNVRKDPFSTMALNFCKEIHQNLNSQMLRWCVEKVLRRLKFLDMKNVPKEPTLTLAAKTWIQENIKENTKTKPLFNKDSKLVTVTNTIPSIASTEPDTETNDSPSTQPSSTLATEKFAPVEQIVKGTPTFDGTAFFPDNEELESNLKQYEMKPDREGNVYFDGSIHASEIRDTESQSMDDIMPPGLESNSRVEMDPRAFNLQAQRRAFVRKLNAKTKITLG